VPRAYWLAWNVLILLVGAFFGLLALSERNPLALAAFFIVVGSGAHWFEYLTAVSKGRCEPAIESGWIERIRAVDRCLDFSEPWVLGAQAALIAGGLVIAVKLGLGLRRLIRTHWRWG